MICAGVKVVLTEWCVGATELRARGARMKGNSLVVVEHNAIEVARMPSFRDSKHFPISPHPSRIRSPPSPAPRAAPAPREHEREASRRPRGGEVLCGSSSSKGG